MRAMTTSSTSLICGTGRSARSDDADREFWRAEAARLRRRPAGSSALWDGGRLVGAARYLDLRQWWHGRAVPMAGVGGVKVAPEARGRGVGRALMTELIGAMAERGYSLSRALSGDRALYRSLGWEMAGGFYRAEIPGRSLGSLLPPDPGVPVPAAEPGGTLAGRWATGRRRRCGGLARGRREVIAVLAAVHCRCPRLRSGDARSRQRAALAGRARACSAYLAPDGFLGLRLARRQRPRDHGHVLAAGSARDRAGAVGDRRPRTPR